MYRLDAGKSHWEPSPQLLLTRSTSHHFRFSLLCIQITNLHVRSKVSLYMLLFRISYSRAGSRGDTIVYNRRNWKIPGNTSPGRPLAHSSRWTRLSTFIHSFHHTESLCSNSILHWPHECSSSLSYPSTVRSRERFSGRHTHQQALPATIPSVTICAHASLSVMYTYYYYQEFMSNNITITFICR